MKDKSSISGLATLQCSNGEIEQRTRNIDGRLKIAYDAVHP